MDNKYFKDILSFDGKVDKGSARGKGYITEETKPLNVLNVYSDKLEMCIDQEMIEEKTNEITVIPEIVERLNLKNVICTWDTLNTQKENIKAVRAKGGDYCVALKGNHPSFYKDVQDYFDEDRLMIIKSGYEGCYQLTREKSHEAVITYAIRKHWNVENKLHWQMDFTFKSDNNTTVNKRSLFNLQIIKKFCLKILNKVKKVQNKTLKRIRKSISRNIEKETIEIFKLLRNLDYSILS